MQNVFLQKRHLELADLYNPPLSSFGEDAVERWFSQEEVDEMLGFVESLTILTDPKLDFVRFYRDRRNVDP